MTVTIVIEYADRKLHGGLPGKEEKNECPGRMGPGGADGKEGDNGEYEYNRLYVGKHPKAYDKITHTAFLLWLHEGKGLTFD